MSAESQTVAGWIGENMRHYLILIMSVVAVSCTTNAGGYTTEAAVEARLMEMDRAGVLEKLGAPNDAYQLDDNRETWSYRSLGGGRGFGGLIDGECVINISFVGDEVATVNVNARSESPVSFPLGACRDVIRNLD